jgi:hypothetical protein
MKRIDKLETKVDILLRESKIAMGVRKKAMEDRYE